MKQTFFLLLITLGFSLVSCKKEYTAATYNEELVETYKSVDDLYQLCLKQIESQPKTAKETLEELKKKISKAKKNVAKIPAFEGEEEYLPTLALYLDFCENISKHGLKDFVEIKNKSMNDSFDDARVDMLTKELDREYNKASLKFMTKSIQFAKYYDLEVDTEFWKKTA